MPRQIIEQLKALRHEQVSPSNEWVRENRARLLMQIKNTVPVANSALRAKAVIFENVWSGLSIILPRPLVYNVIRPLAVFLIVALVVSSSRIAAVDAAFQAEPGDFVYTVLRAAQKTQVAVAAFMGDKNTETKLHIQFANDLANKTKQLSQAGGPKKNAQLAVAMSDLKSELNSISDKLGETKNNVAGGSVAANVVNDVKQGTDQIKNVLQDLKNNLQTDSTGDSDDLAQEVNDTKDLVKDVSIQAMGVMVGKLNSGDKTFSEAQVKQALDKTLTSAASDIAASSQTVQGLKTSVETVQTGLTIDGGSAGASSTNKEISDKISTVSDVAKLAVQQTSQANLAVDQKVSEAKSLLTGTSTDSMAKAMDTLKQVTEVNKQTEKISDSAVQKVQTVIPVASAPATDGGSAITTTTQSATETKK